MLDRKSAGAKSENIAFVTFEGDFLDPKQTNDKETTPCKLSQPGLIAPRSQKGILSVCLVILSFETGV